MGDEVLGGRTLLAVHREQHSVHGLSSSCTSVITRHEVSLVYTRGGTCRRRTLINRRVVLRSRPVDVPPPNDFEIVSGDVPEPADGEILVRNLFFSLEPAIRARLDGKETYMPPIGIDEVIESPTVGRVVRSKAPPSRRARSSSASPTGRTTPSSPTTRCCSTACLPRTTCRSPTTSARSAARARPRTSACTTSVRSRRARQS